MLDEKASAAWRVSDRPDDRRETCHGDGLSDLLHLLRLSGDRNLPAELA